MAFDEMVFRALSILSSLSIELNSSENRIGYGSPDEPRRGAALCSNNVRIGGRKARYSACAAWQLLCRRIRASGGLLLLSTENASSCKSPVSFASPDQESRHDGSMMFVEQIQCEASENYDAKPGSLFYSRMVS